MGVKLGGIFGSSSRVAKGSQGSVRFTRASSGNLVDTSLTFYPLICTWYMLGHANVCLTGLP